MKYSNDFFIDFAGPQTSDPYSKMGHVQLIDQTISDLSK
jgi:hypothetical protein